MSANLPVDPEKPGNVWCEACQQSISENRGAAHLVSKKHTGNAAPAASSSKTAKTAKGATDPDDEDITAAVVTTKKSSVAGLPDDPEKAGHKWCGICQVSLAAAKAEGHLETARHKDNSVKHLSSAMKAAKISAK